MDAGDGCCDEMDGLIFLRLRFVSLGIFANNRREHCMVRASSRITADRLNGRRCVSIAVIMRTDWIAVSNFSYNMNMIDEYELH